MSAPEQNAGGAPVTTSAPTPGSASSASTACDDLLDESRGERVAALGVVERQHRDAIVPFDVEAHSLWRPSERRTAGE